jgi:hypothetical protein
MIGLRRLTSNSVIRTSLSFGTSGESLPDCSTLRCDAESRQIRSTCSDGWRGIGGDACPFSLVARCFQFSAGIRIYRRDCRFWRALARVTGPQENENIIRQVLQKDGAQIESDNFVGTTPRGPISVHNIIGKFNVSTNPKQRIFVLAGHYDIVFKHGFIGANDGASLIRRPGCKSGWSGPTWKRRSTISKERRSLRE